MNKKLPLMVLLLVLALVLFVAACGGEQETTTTVAPTESTAAPATTGTTGAPATTGTTAAGPAEKIKLTFSDHNPAGHYAAEGLKAYAEYIAEKSGGRVEVDLQLGGALYGNIEVFDGVRTGGADVGHYVLEAGDGFYYTLVHFRSGTADSAQWTSSGPP